MTRRGKRATGRSPMGGRFRSAPNANDAEVYDPMRLFLAAAAALVLTIPMTSAAVAQPVDRHHCSAACVKRVKHRVLLRARHRARERKLAFIRPYTAWLEKTGACESGTGSYSLSVGLRALSPGGKYRGRYQFDWDSWGRAGGTGDPIDADWLTQAYIAVRWLRMVGNGAWPICGH